MGIDYLSIARYVDNSPAHVAILEKHVMVVEGLILDEVRMCVLRGLSEACIALLQGPHSIFYMPHFNLPRSCCFCCSTK